MNRSKYITEMWKCFFQKFVTPCQDYLANVYKLFPSCTLLPKTIEFGNGHKILSLNSLNLYNGHSRSTQKDIIEAFRIDTSNRNFRSVAAVQSLGDDVIS